MASSKFSYQKLRKLPIPSAEDDHGERDLPGPEAVVGVSRSWLRLRRRRWRRPRVRIAGLGRLLRKKARKVRSVVGRVVKRFKESRPYIGDLFAGNYMFMQVNPSPTTPTSISAGGKSFFPGAGGQYYGAVMGASVVSSRTNMHMNVVSFAQASRMTRDLV